MATSSIVKSRYNKDQAGQALGFPSKNIVYCHYCTEKFTCQVPRPQHAITFECDSVIQLATMMERRWQNIYDFFGPPRIKIL